METTQRIFQCSYLYLKQEKHHAFIFVSYLFSYTKLEDRKAKQVLPGREGWLTLVGGGSGRERDRRMNTVEKMCTHVCKCKHDTC
jgi:hypothetical protein